MTLRLLDCWPAAAALFLVFGFACAKPTTKNSSRSSDIPTIALTDAPVGADATSVQWMKVITADAGIMLAAVARPSGHGPFPTLIILHGTHGFAQEYVRLAQDLARNGVLGVAACWFSGRRGAGVRFITPIECADAPPLVQPSDSDRFRMATQSVDALVHAVRTLSGVIPDRIALFGHSRGGGAALNYVLLRPGTVQAAVLNSTGYPSEVVKRAAEIDIPILMVHGTADIPADGGSEFTSIEKAREFESALRREGKRIEVKYYEGSGHNSVFTVPAQYDDTVHRITAFLQRHLLN